LHPPKRRSWQGTVANPHACAAVGSCRLETDLKNPDMIKVVI
jgi:hypothetical protein